MARPRGNRRCSQLFCQAMERPHYAKGLCRQCYSKTRGQLEKTKARQSRYNATEKGRLRVRMCKAKRATADTILELVALGKYPPPDATVDEGRCEDRAQGTPEGGTTPAEAPGQPAREAPEGVATLGAALPGCPEDHLSLCCVCQQVYRSAGSLLAPWYCPDCANKLLSLSSIRPMP